MDESIRSYTIAELTRGLEVIIEGDPACLIYGVCAIQHAKPGYISFLANPSYKKYLSDACCAAVILSQKDASSCRVTKVIAFNPYYVYAKIASFFVKPTSFFAGIHHTVVIGQECQIDPSASIGAYSVIGDGVHIAKDVVIGPGCTIESNVMIDEATHLSARVFLGHDVKIGRRVCLASGVVIGSDGFGFAKHEDEFYKIPQLGSVVIGDEVDIGANTTIDRGTVENTVIEKGVKLDNQIQIGHNVHIGEHTVICGCTGIAGTAMIGKNCMIGGGCCINGHITITDHVWLTATTNVSRSILIPGTYSSGLLNLDVNRAWLKANAKLKRLLTSDEL